MPQDAITPAHREHAAFVRDALQQLGIRRFVLGIHASAFPAAELDAGHGAPLSSAGDRVLGFAAQLGFGALQLGPCGQVSVSNLSPYDGTVFARNTWSLALAPLTQAGLLPAALAQQLTAASHDASRLDPGRAQRVMEATSAACHAHLLQLRAAEPTHALLADLERFRRAQAPWLESNAVYEAIAAVAGDDPARFDPALAALFEPGPAGLARRELMQYLCHAQHAAFRARAHAPRGSRCGRACRWASRTAITSCTARRSRLTGCSARRPAAPTRRASPGATRCSTPISSSKRAPPRAACSSCACASCSPSTTACASTTRTAWSAPGCTARTLPTRCTPCAMARARSSRRTVPSRSCSAGRSRGARTSTRAPTPRFADDRVRALDDAQVARYARLFDVLARALPAGAALHEVFAAEVLSTCPHPLARVLQRHDLGRFRVTQKANPADPRDVYRTEHAQAHDWLMLGTHDTPPAYAVAEGWLGDGSAHARAQYLAQRLIREPFERPRARAEIAASAHNLLVASLADLFNSRAENVFVFVGDLFGETEPFNRAGIVHPDNWTARLPADFEAVYAARLRAGRALDIVAALRLALSGRWPRVRRAASAHRPSRPPG